MKTKCFVNRYLLGLIGFFAIAHTMLANGNHSDSPATQATNDLPYATRPLPYFDLLESNPPAVLPTDDFQAIEKQLAQQLNTELKKIQFNTPNNGDNDDVSNGSIGQPLGQTMALVDKAHSAIGKIKNGAKFISQLTGGDLVSFPIGIKTEIGNMTYIMGINGMSLYPNYAQLEVFLEIEGGNLERPLLFYSPNVKFNANQGIIGGASLGLLGDAVVNIVEGKSVILLKQGIANEDGEFESGTYVDIGCNGFKELSIDAEVHFSRDWIKPVNDTTTVVVNNSAPVERVVGSFSLVVQDWNDILVEIDLQDFVITRLEDVKWRISTAVFDFSETMAADSTTLEFPVNGYTPAESGNLWKGFYIASFQVELPERITGSNPILIAGNDIVIDSEGFTGIASATSTPLLDISQGNAGGWAISVEHFSISLIAGELDSIAFNGRINVPLFGENDGEETNNNPPTNSDSFSYTAFIAMDNHYGFAISPDSTMAVKCWKATATLYPNSNFILDYDDGDFTATANIYGDITVDGELGTNANVSIPPIGVEGMVLSNKVPYFQAGTWTLPDSVGASIGAFSLSILDPIIYDTLVNNIPEVGLDFEVSVGLDTDLAIEATGGFRIRGELDISGTHHKWQPKQFSITSLELEASFAGVAQVSASIAFFDAATNPDYGTGFRGTAEVYFDGAADIGIGAVAQFGTMPDANYKYFMIDVLAEFSGVAICPGLELCGIGGGIYRHMTQQGVDAAFANFQEGDVTTIGASLSGIQYIPNESTALGFKASVVLSSVGTSEDRGFSANVGFGMEFGNSNGSISIQRILFQGNGRFMADIDMGGVPSGADAINVEGTNQEETFTSDTAPNEAPINAFVLIDLNLQEQIYDARLKIFANIQNRLTGQAWAAMHFNKPENIWWVHVGKPSDRISLNLNATVLNADIAAYFMMASSADNLEAVPPPFDMGSEAANAANNVPTDLDFNYTGQRNESILSGGQGFAFGSAVAFSAGNREFFFMYGNISGGLGHDILIQKQYSDCPELTDIGVNGWYAKGQAWAYLDAEIGAKIKIFTKEKKIPLLDALIAAALRIELPNPFWAEGLIHINVVALGGLINVEEDFEFEIGNNLADVLPESCQVAQGDALLAELDIIQDITLSDPNANLDNVSVATDIIVNMEVPHADLLEFVDDDGTNIYRVILEPLDFQDQYGETINLGIGDDDHAWNDDNTIFTDSRINFFPGNTTITATAIARFQKLISGDPNSTDATWQTVVDEDTGEPLVETKFITFTTGERPSVIPPENVAISYPLPNQQHFFKDQYDNGYYAQLSANQYYLFDEIPDGYAFKGRIKDMNGNLVGSLLNAVASIYNSGGDSSTFGDEEEVHHTAIGIDKNNALENDTPYQLEFVIIHENGAVDPDYGEEHILYTIDFKTSIYSTLVAKMASTAETSHNYQNGGDETVYNDVIVSTQSIGEGFEAYELEGGDNFHPLISLEVVYEWTNDGADYQVSSPEWLNTFAVKNPLVFNADCITWDLDNPFEAVHIANQSDGAFDLVLDFPSAIYNFNEAVKSKIEDLECCITGQACGNWDPDNPSGSNGSGSDNNPPPPDAGGNGPSADYRWFLNSNNVGPNDPVCNPYYSTAYCNDNTDIYEFIASENSEHRILIKYNMPRASTINTPSTEIIVNTVSQ